MRTIHAVDLFAGAGGTSTGLVLAAQDLGKKLELTAINHWQRAIDTHSANHPWAKHILSDIQFVDPREVVAEKRLNILVASPSCVHFSRAAGGRPKNDQQRSSAGDILRWFEFIDIKSALIENVPEFETWGPLDKRGFPIKERRGAYYRKFLKQLREYGFTVDTRILNSADYGAATSRRRLFIAAKKGAEKITWPEPTHARVGPNKWKPAREIIDWAIKGESIFTRKKPLSRNTIRRIITGLKKFGTNELRPFIILMEHGGGVRDLQEPLPTITTAKGGAMALADPFLTLNDHSNRNGPDTRGLEEPLPTITGSANFGLVEPFVLSQASGGAPRSTECPLPTIPTGGAHALIEPFIVHYHKDPPGKERASSLEDPLATIDTSNRYAMVESFILPNEGIFRGNTAKSVDEPLGTITQRGAGGLVEAHILRENNHCFGSSLEDPLPALTTVNKLGLIESHLIQYNGNSQPHSIEEPLPTISTRDRFGLVQPVINGKTLDIRFRMLQPHELAAAMGFPSHYKFQGPKNRGRKTDRKRSRCPGCKGTLFESITVKKWNENVLR